MFQQISSTLSINNHILKLPGIFVLKRQDLSFVHCNQGFLDITGSKSEETIAGLNDSCLPWREYADIYHEHDTDALKGKEYTCLQPVKDYKGNEHLYICQKKQWLNDADELLGVISHALEISNTNLHKIVNLLGSKKLPKQPAFYVGKTNEQIKLTKKEEECLFYLLRGKTSKEIGRKMNISHRTVEHHLDHAKKKLNCNTRSELIEEAINRGFSDLIPPEIISNNLIRFLQD